MTLYNPSDNTQKKQTSPYDESRNGAKKAYDTILSKLKNPTSEQLSIVNRQVNSTFFGVGDPNPLWDFTDAKIDSILYDKPTVEVAPNKEAYNVPEMGKGNAPLTAPLPQEQAVTSTQNIPDQPIVDKQGELPSFTYHDPLTGDQTLQAVGWDKYGKPIWKRQVAGQTIGEEFINWTTQLHTEDLYQQYLDKKNARQNAEYALKNKSDDKIDALVSQGVSAEDAVKSVGEPTEKQIEDRMAIDKVTNAINHIGRVSWTALEMLGGITKTLERAIGTTMIMTKGMESGQYIDGEKQPYGVKQNWKERDKLVKDITWDEAWQASRITYSVFGQNTAKINEFIRRYREPGSDPNAIQEDLENPIAELVGQALGDPFNMLDDINNTKKIASVLGKSDVVADPTMAKFISEFGDDAIEQIVPEAKVVAKAENIVDDIVPDATQTEITGIDTSLPFEQQLPVAKRNIEISDVEFENARSLTDEAKAKVKALKESGATPEEIAIAQEEATALGKVADKAKRQNVKWNKNLAAIQEAQRNEQAMGVVRNTVKETSGVADGMVSDIPKPKTNIAEQKAQRIFDYHATQIADAESDIAKSAKSFSQTQSMKTAIWGDRVRDVVTLLRMGSEDTKDFGKMIMSMVVMADGKATKANRAVALQNILKNKKLASIILSKRGAQVGVLMREMFTNLDGSIGVAKLQSILDGANLADDPLLFMAEKLDEKAFKMVNQVFPDIYTRMDNVAKIDELQKAGKPIPAYLKRFMVDGEAEQIPDVVKATANAHRKIQHDLIAGKGVAELINKPMSAAFIAANPPVWFRNAASNATHIMVDGHNPFFTGADMSAYLAKMGGAPSMTDVKMGKGSAIPGMEKVEKHKNKYINWLMSVNENIEGFQGKQVTIHAMQQAMGEMKKVIFNDLTPSMKAAGYTDDEVRKLTDIIFDDLDVDKGVENLYHIEAHRTLSDLLPPEDVAKLEEYGFSNAFNDAYKKSKNKEQLKQRFQEIMQQIDEIGSRSDIEEAVIDPQSKHWRDVEDIADMPNNGSISKAEYDYISRRTIATNEAFDSVRKTLKQFRQSTFSKINSLINAGSPDTQKLTGIQESILRLVDDTEAQFNKLASDAKKMKDAKFNRNWWNETNLLRNTDEESYFARVREYLDYRDQMYRTLAATQVEMFQKTGVEASNLLKGIDGLPQIDLTNFDEAAATIDRWNDVDIEAYNTFGKFVSKTTGEVIPNPDGDSTISFYKAIKNSEFGDVFQKLLNGVDQHYDNIRPSDVTPEKMDALKAFLPKARARLMEAKAKAFEFGNAAREATLLDYRKKDTFDIAAAYLMPFQFWYRHTYKNWIGRILSKPGLAIAYAQYRQTMEKINADMPEWYRYQINIGKMIGLPDDNPLFFGLEQMINPLNALTGMDYNDSRRKKDMLPQAIDTLGKFGPAVHPLFSYMIAAYYAVNRDKDAAEAWAGRLLPQTKLIKDLSASVGIHGSDERGGLTPGGLELDPIIWAQGGMDSYETKRVTRKLAEMVQRGEISDEDASQAAYDHSGETWQLAWQYAQNDPNSPIYERRSVLSAFGGVFGTGLRGRTQEDVLNDKFFEEYSLLRGIQNNLSPAEYKQKLVQLYERYPFGEYLVLSKKNDQYRDQAWAYSVLDRVAPGTLSGVARSVGLDAGILDKFYEDKGRIDKWDKSDRDVFMAKIRDISVVIKIPPESTQHDYNVARIRNIQLNEYLKSQFGEDIIDRMNAIYDIEANDIAAKQKYLRDNPDVQEAIDVRSQEVLSDEILNSYYGGIDALETYLQYQKRGRAQELFGEDIFQTVSDFYAVRDSGFDTKAYLDDHPELSKYFDWNEDQKKVIDDEINSWGQTHLPSNAKNIVNPMAAINSVGQRNLADALQEANVNADAESRIAPYASKRAESDYTTSFSQAAYIDEQAEKRWPGITDVIKEFEAAKSNPAKAQQMWASDSRISMYYKLVSGLQSQFSQAEKGNFPGSDQEMRDMVQQSMSPELYRLATDIVNGMEPSKTAEKQLKKIATKLGLTYNQLLMYIIQ